MFSTLGRGLTVNHRANDKTPMLDFLKNGLTDPRVAAETYPFDRPTLRSESNERAIELVTLSRRYTTVGAPDGD